MIEISLGKLVLLALIALIVLGPEKLPEVARTAGALLRRIRGSWDSVRAEVERELQIEEIKRAARAAAAHAETAQSELDDTLKQVREPFADAATQLGAADSKPPAEGVPLGVMRPLDRAASESPSVESSKPDDPSPVAPKPGTTPHGD